MRTILLGAEKTDFPRILFCGHGGVVDAKSALVRFAGVKGTTTERRNSQRELANIVSRSLLGYGESKIPGETGVGDSFAAMNVVGMKTVAVE